MPDPVNLTGEIVTAIDGAVLRGHPLAVAFVRDDASASVTFRGGTYVYNSTQLAIWVRKRDSGFASAIESHPRVSLVYYGGHEGPGPAFLSFKGSARVDESANDAVYDAMVELERNQDLERKGVAVIIDVDSVDGFVPNEGMFRMERSA